MTYDTGFEDQCPICKEMAPSYQIRCWGKCRACQTIILLFDAKELIKDGLNYPYMAPYNRIVLKKRAEELIDKINRLYSH